MVRPALPVLVALALAVSACGGSRPAPPPTFGQLPLTFVQQEGDVKFLAQGPGHSFFVTPDQIALTLERPSGQGVALKLRFVGSNPHVAIGGEQRSRGTVNYVGGRTGVPATRASSTASCGPESTWRCTGQEGELKYEFRVRPGRTRATSGSPTRERRAARRRRRAAHRHRARRAARRGAGAFQGGRRSAPHTRVRRPHGYGFTVGAYDPSRTLVIDPGLAYSTFLGGTSNEIGRGIAVDAAGNTYVTGITQSPNFPTTTGAFDRTGAAPNNLDVFVTKLNPAGTARVYSTFIGGTNFDWGRAITRRQHRRRLRHRPDEVLELPDHRAARSTASFNVDNCPRCGIDQYDAFVLKLNPAGSALVYSTFLGGFDIDDSLGIALDGARNAYVTGQTGSSDFPTTAGAFDRTAGGGFDAFVDQAQRRRLGAGLLDPAGRRGQRVAGGRPRRRRRQRGGRRVDALDRLPDHARRVRHDPERRRVRRALRPLRDQAQLRRLGPRLLDVRRRLQERLRRRLRARRRRQRLHRRRHLSPDFPAGVRHVRRQRGLRAEAQPGRLRARLLDVPRRRGRGRRRRRERRQRLARRRQRAGRSRRPPTRSTRSSTAARSTRTSPGSNATGSVAVRELPRRLGVARRRPTSRSTAPATSTSPATPTRRTSRTTPGAFDRTWAGDPLIFWGDAFVAKVDVGATAPPGPAAPAPAAPALASPADGPTVAPPVTFDWSDVTGAGSYTIQVDEISAVRRAADPQRRPRPPRQLTTSALPDGNWFWRVRGVNSEGTPRRLVGGAARSRSQSHADARAAARAGRRDAVSPADGATVAQPFTFDWSDVANAAWYVIEVDDSSTSRSLVWAATTTPSSLATNSLPNGDAVLARAGVQLRRRRRRRTRRSRTVDGRHRRGPLAGAVAASARRNDARFSPGQAITFDWSDVAGAAATRSRSTTRSRSRRR